MDALKIHKRGSGKKVLLCLHGFLGEAGDWESFAESFLVRLKVWQVVMIDLPGHSAEEPEWQCPVVDVFAGSLRDLVEREGWGRVAIAGYSLGGRLALHTALSFPGVFSDFVGISTLAGIEDEAERALRIASDAALATKLRSRGDFAGFLSEWWNQPVFASPARHSGDFKKFLDSRLRRNPERMAACLETWSAGRLPSKWSSLPAYPGRALILSGACDAKYTLAAARMQSAFSNANRMVVPSAGHQLLLEKPVEVANAVADFLTL